MKLNKALGFKLMIGLPVMMALLLSGCGNNEKRAELEEYVKKVKSRSIKEIEPLPEMKPFKTFTYHGSNLRSPFVPTPTKQAVKNLPDNNGIRPDVNRPKEILESFPLDSLRMVGTVEKNGKKWALVVDPKGTVYRITEGNYVGQNYGKIDKISEEKVLLTEIIPDIAGGWRERKTAMVLNDEQAVK